MAFGAECSRCYATSCSCGWAYRNWEMKWLVELYKIIGKVMAFRKENVKKDKEKVDDDLFLKYMED